MVLGKIYIFYMYDIHIAYYINNPKTPKLIYTMLR